MTKRQAWWTLLEPVAFITFGWLVGVLVGNVVVSPTAGAIEGITIQDSVTVTETQAVILGAAVTAVLGLLGAWSVKAREFRNHRADTAAEVALAYYGVLHDFFELVKRVDTDLEGAGKRIKEIAAEMETVREQARHAKWHHRATKAEAEALDARLAALEGEEERIADRIGLAQMTKFFDDLEPALARLRMYGTIGIFVFAQRAIDALALYYKHPTDQSIKTNADRAVSRFLDESRTSVTATRRWWGRRFAHLFRVMIIHQVERWRTAIRVVRGIPDEAVTAVR